MTTEVMERKDFLTPRGARAVMLLREGTADHNNVHSCLDGDEYGLRDLFLGDGVALDVGAHTGGVTMALAIDNPDCHVIAVEALGANVEVLRANAEANGVADRVTIIHGAATKPGPKTATVRWNFDDTESGRHHRFIANAQLVGESEGESEEVKAWSLKDLPSDIAFAKIDCELCEYNLLQSPAVKRIAEIRGEFHAGFERIVEMLGETHVVTQTGGGEGIGAFMAVRR